MRRERTGPRMGSEVKDCEVEERVSAGHDVKERGAVVVVVGVIGTHVDSAAVCLDAGVDVEDVEVAGDRYDTHGLP